MSRLQLTLLLLALTFGNAFSQTNIREIASNRIIQHYHNQAQLEKIANLDSNRIQTLWSYFTASFSFTSEDQSVDLIKLLNIYHFDVYTFESQRDLNNPVSFTFHDNVTITLKSGNELTQILGSYTLTDLIEKIPFRAFPTWTSQTFTDSDFQTYKEKVWDWARDYPTEYLALTSDISIPHYHFSDLSMMPFNRISQLLTGQYIIVD